MDQIHELSKFPFCDQVGQYGTRFTTT